MNSTTREHSSSWTIAAAALLITLFLYVAIYAAFFRPPAIHITPGSHDTYYIVYKNSGIRILFAPLRQLDQALFPERWAGYHQRIYSPPPARSP